MHSIITLLEIVLLSNHIMACTYSISFDIYIICELNSPQMVTLAWLSNIETFKYLMWFDIFIGILLNVLQVVFNQEDIIMCDKNIDSLIRLSPYHAQWWLKIYYESRLIFAVLTVLVLGKNISWWHKIQHIACTKYLWSDSVSSYSS